MRPIRSREGVAFPRDVLSAKKEGHPEKKVGLPGSGWEAYKVRRTGLVVHFPCHKVREGLHMPSR